MYSIIFASATYVLQKLQESAVHATPMQRRAPLSLLFPVEPYTLPYNSSSSPIHAAHPLRRKMILLW